MPDRMAIRAGLAAALVAAFAGHASAQDQTFGKDIPLNFAARQIVPSGYKVDIGPGVDGDAKVSWPKSENWRKSIQSAAASRGYVAKVDGQVVTISGQGPKVTKASMGADMNRPERAMSDAPAAPDAGADADADADAGHARREARERRRVAMEGDFRRSHGRRRHVREASYEERREVRHYGRRRDVGEGREEAVSGPVVPDSGFVMMPEHVRAERAPGPGPDGGPDAGQGPRGGGFVARQGETLAGTLQGWAERDGWRVEWKSQYQYVLKSSARLDGDFVTATTELLRSMGEVRPQPTAEFFRGNKVLVIGNHGPDEAAQ